MYEYTVASANSSYVLGGDSMGESREALVGFHGEVDVDADTGEVLHVTYEADRIPKELNIDEAVTSVDYDFADVGGQQYLLPSHSELQMRRQQQSIKNDADLRDYRKFSADSNIQYGTGK